jgi:hypothetical protein
MLDLFFVKLPLVSFDVVSNELPEENWFTGKRKK